jgi:hypothetical protein
MKNKIGEKMKIDRVSKTSNNLLLRRAARVAIL